MTLHSLTATTSRTEKGREEKKQVLLAPLICIAVESGCGGGGKYAFLIAAANLSLPEAMMFMTLLY